MMRALVLLLAVAFASAMHTAALPLSRSLAAARSPAVEMSRICDLSGKSANNANRVTFSNKHNAYRQYPNLQTKKFFSPSLNRTVRLKVACSTIRTIRKLGLDETAAHFKVDLSKF